MSIRETIAITKDPDPNPAQAWIPIVAITTNLKSVSNHNLLSQWATRLSTKRFSTITKSLKSFKSRKRNLKNERRTSNSKKENSNSRAKLRCKRLTSTGRKRCSKSERKRKSLSKETKIWLIAKTKAKLINCEIRQKNSNNKLMCLSSKIIHWKKTIRIWGKRCRAWLLSWRSWANNGMRSCRKWRVKILHVSTRTLSNKINLIATESEPIMAKEGPASGTNSTLSETPTRNKPLLAPGHPVLSLPTTNEVAARHKLVAEFQRSIRISRVN